MPLDPEALLLKSPPVATVEQTVEYLRKVEPASNPVGGKSEQYVREVYRLYPESQISPDITVAQFAVETGAGSSQLWQTRLNPAGIGVTDGGDRGHSWATPANAARGHIVHLSGYVDGYNKNLRLYLPDDPRYLLLLGTAYAASARYVSDLQGTWATDPKYGEKIAWRLENIRLQATDPPPPDPGTITFGRVPQPSWVDRQIPDSQNIAWSNLGPRKVKGVVYHRQVGTNWGTDGWFRLMWQPNGQPGGGQLGLTDFGIDRSTGQILQWNDYLGRGREGISPNRSGHASGPWENPPGDGRAFVAKYGTSAINRDLVSLEIDGWYDSPIGSKGFREIVRISAFLADQAKIPWTTYPLNPHTGLVFTYTHNEFQNHKPCPGQVVMSQVNTIILETQKYMKIWQTGV
jgi:hypothetical protein